MSDAHRARPAPVAPPQPDCWRTIGISGDKSCPELATYIHCRNCPVLADAARMFFEREAPAGYLDAWREILEEPVAEAEAESTSVLVFRLGSEWFALPTDVLVEVTPPRPLHRVPHRDGGGLAGIVNIRGQLQLCMSLHAILGLPGGPTVTTAVVEPAARLLVVERGGDAGLERWVLGVDEYPVAGCGRCHRPSASPKPAARRPSSSARSGPSACSMRLGCSPP
jgi:chemotaxis signal transduction protein